MTIKGRFDRFTMLQEEEMMPARIVEIAFNEVLLVHVDRRQFGGASG